MIQAPSHYKEHIEVPPELVKGSVQDGESIWDEVRLYFSVLLKFKWLFIFCFCLLTSMGWWYLTRTGTYTSKARFIVTDWNRWNPSTNSPVVLTNQSQQSLMWFLSDSVILYIIEKYHLEKRSADPASSKEHSILTRTVSDWISIADAGFGSYIVKVETADRVLSANIANDVVRKAQDYNRQMTIDELSNRIHVLKTLITTTATSDTNDVIVKRFEDIQKSLDLFLSSSASSTVVARQLDEIRTGLESLSQQYNDRLVQLRLNEMMLKNLSSNTANSIVLIQAAVPDYDDYTVLRLIYAVIVALALCSLVPIMIYGYYKIRGHPLHI